MNDDTWLPFQEWPVSFLLPWVLNYDMGIPFLVHIPMEILPFISPSYSYGIDRIRFFSASHKCGILSFRPPQGHLRGEDLNERMDADGVFH